MNSKNIKERINVLEIVLHHLYNSFTSVFNDVKPKGGIFIKPKPKKTRVDVIEINLLVVLMFDHTLEGVVNINIQDEDLERIKQLSSIVIDLMDCAYTDGYLFIYEQSIYLKVSKTLYIENVRIKFELSKEKYNKQITYTETNKS